MYCKDWRFKFWNRSGDAKVMRGRLVKVHYFALNDFIGLPDCVHEIHVFKGDWTMCL
jgi:hypothetical protein